MIQKFLQVFINTPIRKHDIQCAQIFTYLPTRHTNRTVSLFKNKYISHKLYVYKYIFIYFIAHKSPLIIISWESILCKFLFNCSDVNHNLHVWSEYILSWKRSMIPSWYIKYYNQIWFDANFLVFQIVRNNKTISFFIKEWKNLDK